MKIFLLPLTVIAERLQEQVNATAATLQPGIDAIKADYRGEERTRRTIALYRESLERRVVDTGGWWDKQLGLSLLGMAVTFAWEKAVGDADELAWWERAAIDGSRWMD